MTPRARIIRSIAKVRALPRPQLVLGLFLVPLLLGDGCLPDTAPDDVRSIEGFVQCLNNRIIGGDIADAVQCLPCGCTLTLTKSARSAQPACSHGGCQLPRILVNCPGPPQFQPSFSLCVTDPDGGLDRVEIGEVINAQGHMRMGDVHVGPGGYVYTDPSEPVSKVDDSGPGDSKQCWTCHDHDDLPLGAEAISHPEPYQIFGVGCVIGTDEPCQLPDAGNCNPQHHNEPVTAQNLDEVCACIDAGVNEDGHPLDSDEGRRAAALCHALQNYRDTRGICGSTECPQNEGPDCSALATGVDCDPYIPGEGGTAASGPTGYTCQEVAPGLKQCVSTRVCVDYALRGGGKFLDEDGVSLLRLAVTGKAAVEGECPIADSTDITCEVSAFDHAANTVVEGASLATFTATDLGGGDLSAEGAGVATVAGSPANIHIDASESGGIPAFAIDDTDAPAEITGGTGETGRSDFQLNQTLLP